MRISASAELNCKFTIRDSTDNGCEMN